MAWATVSLVVSNAPPAIDGSTTITCLDTP